MTASRAIGLFYVPFAVIYIYPGLKLWAFASAIGRLVVSRFFGDADLRAILVSRP